ncbi:ATP-binding cassette domain-containing protein [Clostridiaceae bacterium AF31-3BH]|nr:ATP-binding cassette domain-containing protein [Clostridiaceae bacterium AF31-3BH]
MARTSHMDASKVVIQMKDIVKKFGDFTANDHINLTVHKGEVHAILGENGAGKSTMMNVLCGLYKPTSGQIFINEKEVHFNSPKDAIEMGIGMVHQHFMLIQPFTVTENIILGMEPTKGLTVDKEIAKKKVLELSERYGMKVDPDAKVEDISVGMQQRVEILKVLYRGAETLILDEPTASLTPQEIEGLMEIIENLTADGKSVILITHKLKEITASSDNCTIIRQGKYIQTVKVADVDENELAAMMVGRDVNFKVDKKEMEPGEVVLEVKDLHAKDYRGVEILKGFNLNVRKGEIVGLAGVDGNGQTELQTVKVADVDENELAAMMVGRDVNFKVDKKEMEPSEVVLEVKDLHAKDYRGVEILKGFNLNVRKGEIVGLAGVDGNGQTELVEVLTGLRKAESGTVTMLGKDVFNKSPKETFENGISSIPADRQKHGLILDFSNEDNMILQHFEEEPFSSHGFLNRKAIREHAEELIEKFDVRPRGCAEAPAGTLSGGNQQKVIIAREVTNDKDLLIAVNPTRGLDVGAIEFVHKYLVEQRNKNRAVLLVSFELDEIMSLSDRIEVIFDGQITGSVPGKDADEKELGFMMAGGKTDE